MQIGGRGCGEGGSGCGHSSDSGGLGERARAYSGGVGGAGTSSTYSGNGAGHTGIPGISTGKTVRCYSGEAGSGGLLVCFGKSILRKWSFFFKWIKRRRLCYC